MNEPKKVGLYSWWNEMMVEWWQKVRQPDPNVVNGYFTYDNLKTGKPYIHHYPQVCNWPREPESWPDWPSKRSTHKEEEAELRREFDSYEWVRFPDEETILSVDEAVRRVLSGELNIQYSAYGVQVCRAAQGLFG